MTQKTITTKKFPKEYLWLEYERTSRAHDFYFQSILFMLLGSAILSSINTVGAKGLLAIAALWFCLYLKAYQERKNNLAKLKEGILSGNK